MHMNVLIYRTERQVPCLLPSPLSRVSPADWLPAPSLLPLCSGGLKAEGLRKEVGLLVELPYNLRSFRSIFWHVTHCWLDLQLFCQKVITTAAVLLLVGCMAGSKGRVCWTFPLGNVHCCLPGG